MSYMKRSSRLSAALHVLVHLAQRPDVRFTSEDMATWWRTNPVVVRRALAGLRSAGLVSSTTGPGGGWRLAMPPRDISLAAIYSALDEHLQPLPNVSESPGCLVEAGVNALLADTWQELDRQLQAMLSDISLADLATRVPGWPHALGSTESRSPPT